ncbi:MAG: DUF5104 domain-containing protein [Ruminococcus sp.]|nr:DUF5104 domain-containing protein [Ruminococcus sp.]
MKRILLIGCLISSLFFFSCDVKNSGNTKSHESEIKNESEIVQNVFEELMYCFEVKDSQRLINLFSETIRERTNLEDEINQSFDFFQGKMISYNKLSNDIYQSHNNMGNYEYKSLRITAENVSTKVENYEVTIYYVIIDEKYSSNIGISMVLIENSDDYCTIGENISVTDDER